jgi:hypothetical protein
MVRLYPSSIPVQIISTCLRGAWGGGGSQHPVAATQREEKFKREERCEEVRGRSQFQRQRKRAVFLLMLVQCLYLLSGKQPLKTENLNCILEIVHQKILYIFYFSCRCTIKFAFVYFREKIAIPGTVCDISYRQYRRKRYV